MRRAVGLGTAVAVAAAVVGALVVPAADGAEGTSPGTGKDVAAPVFPADLVARSPVPVKVDGAALVRRFECNRCHEGLPGEAAALEKRCVGCHVEIVAGTYPGKPKTLAAWRKNVAALRDAPSLAGAGAKFERAWITEFLLEPHDLRPALAMSMPRLAITATEAAAIADWLVDLGGAAGRAKAGDAAAAPGDAGRGAALYSSSKCGECHAFGGAPVATPAPAAPPSKAAPKAVKGSGGSKGPPPVDTGALALAPDLRHTRDRFRAEALAAFLLDPAAFDPEAKMPTFVLAAQDARDLAAFLLEVPLVPAEPVAVPARLPPLARAVRYPEVEKRVFRKVCWHCHSSPAFGLGDGGPGNTGGFGFAPRGLDLSTAAALLSGSFGPDGRRRSVLAPLPDGTPLVVANLWARWSEVAGKPVPGVLGMPLGLPPLTREDIQLVESWIAGGRRL